MCGRFYVDGSVERKIRDLVHESNGKLCIPAVGDIKPSNPALIIRGAEKQIFDAEAMLWGYRQIAGSGLIINARAESVTDKPMFKDSILRRRCVIPANAFYEWNEQKEKVTFRFDDSSVMYMAGFFQKYEEGNRFIILTTEANESMRPVHDRMPVLLDERELKDWIYDFGFVQDVLSRVPGKLCREQEYEQQSFFF